MERQRLWCTFLVVMAVCLLYITIQLLPNGKKSQFNLAPHTLRQQPEMFVPSSATEPSLSIEPRNPSERSVYIEPRTPSEPPVNINSRTQSNLPRTLAPHRPSEHFLTLITTWNHSNSSSFIQNRTFRSWSKFIPEVQIVVYNDDVMVMSQLHGLPGWYVRNVPKVVTPRHMPVLKYMYIETMKHFHSKFYCFVNADILFTNSLIKTLKLLYLKYGALNKPIFFVGQRWNVINITDQEASTDITLTQSVKERGKLFPSWGADYFVVNELYPWEEVPDLAIGIPNFDNWLMTWAKWRHFIAIDVSETVLAVHQSLTKYSYFSGDMPSADYNKKVLKATFGNVNFYTGRTDCLPLYTTFDNRSRLVVTHRTSYKKYCHEV